MLVAVLLLGAVPVAARKFLHDEVDKAFLQDRFAGLIGKTGLDPFDPVSPLAETRVLAIERGERGEIDAALVRFVYADGHARDYRVWLANPIRFRPGWQYTGFDRLYAPHEELPVLSLDAPTAPVRLGTPRRLEQGDPLFAGRWSFDSAPPGGAERLIWSPQGDAVVVSEARPGALRLVLLSLDGGDPLTLPGGAVSLPRWTADGAGLVYVVSDAEQGPSLTMVDRAGNVVWRARGDGLNDFAPVPDGVLILRDGGMWHIPAGATGDVEATWLVDLPEAPATHDRRFRFVPDPAGNRITYSCGRDLCLFDRTDGWHQRVELPDLEPALLPRPDGSWGSAPRMDRSASSKPTSAFWPEVAAAWSPDGQRLAVVQSSFVERPSLLLLDRNGVVLREVPLGPDGLAVSPQWTPDGDLLFLQTYPASGRRLVVVDTTSGEAYDLSQPGWDASGSLSPTGDRLIVSGSFPALWLVPFEWR